MNDTLLLPRFRLFNWFEMLTIHNFTGEYRAFPNADTPDVQVRAKYLNCKCATDKNISLLWLTMAFVFHFNLFFIRRRVIAHTFYLQLKLAGIGWKGARKQWKRLGRKPKLIHTVRQELIFINKNNKRKEKRERKVGTIWRCNHCCRTYDDRGIP